MKSASGLSTHAETRGPVAAPVTSCSVTTGWLRPAVGLEWSWLSTLLNSGAEAVEDAVKIARSATGRMGVAVIDHAYHGRSHLTMAMTAANTRHEHRFGVWTGCLDSEEVRAARLLLRTRARAA